jgi:hypothetical protein
LRLLNFWVGDKHNIVDMFLCNGEHQFADAFRSERIGGDSSRGTVDGTSGLQSVVQSRRSFRFDADKLGAILVPGSDAADESATANGEQQGIEIGRLLLQFESDRSCAEERLTLVVCVYRERTRLGSPALAGGQCVGVALASHHQFRAIAADTLDFFRRSDSGDKNLCRHTEFMRGEGNRCAVVAARGRDDTGLRNCSQE